MKSVAAQQVVLASACERAKGPLKFMLANCLPQRTACENMIQIPIFKFCFDLIRLTGCILTWGSANLTGWTMYCCIHVDSPVNRCLAKLAHCVMLTTFSGLTHTHWARPARFSKLRRGSNFFDEDGGGMLDESLQAIVRLGHGLWQNYQPMPILATNYIKHHQTIPHWTGPNLWFARWRMSMAYFQFGHKYLGDEEFVTYHLIHSPCDICEKNGAFLLRFLKRLRSLGCWSFTILHMRSCAPQSLESRWHAGGSIFCSSERNWFAIQFLHIDTWQHHVSLPQIMPPEENSAEVNLLWWPVPRES